MNNKLKIYIKLPKRLQLNPSSIDEAKFYARKYKQAKTDKDRLKILESLRVNGASWDIITRSCCYLNIFERVVKKQFPEMWR